MGVPARHITFQGQTQTVAAWAKQFGYHPRTLYDRLHRLPLAEAMTPITQPRFAPGVCRWCSRHGQAAIVNDAGQILEWYALPQGTLALASAWAQAWGCGPLITVVETPCPQCCAGSRRCGRGPISRAPQAMSPVRPFNAI